MGTSEPWVVGSATRAPDDRQGQYVGEDRRANPVPGEPFRFGVLAVAVAVLVVTAGGVAWARLTAVSLPAAVDAEAVHRLLTGATAVVATAACLVAVVRWRLIGEASALWIGTGVLVFGVVTVGLADLLPDLYPGAASASSLEALRPASRIIAVAVLFLGAVAPAVDTRLRPRTVVLVSLGALTALTATLDVVPGATESLRSARAQNGFAVLWAVTAGCHVWAARRRFRRHHLAAATMVLGFSLADAVATLGAPSAAAVPGPELLALVAVGLVLIGSGKELESAFVTQRAQMLEKALAVELTNAKRRAEHAAHEERVHDARNAILAIDGAARTLERFRDRLTGEQREALSQAVSEEVLRLQRLIEVNWEQEECEPFEVAALLGPIATTERARGMLLTVDTPGDLVALGRSADTAEVLRNLLDNARRYAPGSPVEVRAERDGAWVVIRVDDRGRGVRRDEREAIFERGQRGSASADTPGTGLGLFVSRRLMREQGGDMWVENRPGGGASFGVCLPAARTTVEGDPLRAAPGEPMVASEVTA